MRSLTFRWESELSESFYKSMEPALWSRQRAGTWKRVMESSCSEGRADIVWGYFAPGHCPSQYSKHAILLQNPTASRILAFTLRHRAARFESDLQRCVGVTAPVFRKWLRELLASGLIVKTKKDTIKAGLIRSIPNVEICSFELKLTNWQRALYQAIRYRTFSHRVFVVMPYDAIRMATANKQAFEKANVGLIAHDKHCGSEVLIRPQKRSPQSAQRAIMALGMLSEQPSTNLPRYGTIQLLPTTVPDDLIGSLC